MASFSQALIAWYRRNKRDLPWRNTRDPYRIWVSEIMLQQTRVAAVIPYYEKFLQSFPTPAALAEAPEQQVLAMWAGLGYYSRARNLQKAARQIAAAGAFPRTYETIRTLAGVGEYTAAAIASIAFGLPHAVLDGNVLRVISRLDKDFSNIAASSTRQRMQARAQELLDARDPSAFNQAMMELGATICLPKEPQCLLCPVSSYCQARQAGVQKQLPVKGKRAEIYKMDRTVLVIQKTDGHLLLWQRQQDSTKLQGFWELPEPEHLPTAVLEESAGSFRHSITNHIYNFQVVRAACPNPPEHFSWISQTDAARLPLSTTTRKALAVLNLMNSSRRLPKGS